MLSFLFKKFAGRHHRKYVEKCRPLVARINEHELAFQSLTDEQLRAKTEEFRARLKQGETLDQVLPEAFAAAGFGQLVRPESVEELAAAMLDWSRRPPLPADARAKLHETISRHYSVEAFAQRTFRLYTQLAAAR